MIILEKPEYKLSRFGATIYSFRRVPNGNSQTETPGSTLWTSWNTGNIISLEFVSISSFSFFVGHKWPLGNDKEKEIKCKIEHDNVLMLIKDILARQQPNPDRNSLGNTSMQGTPLGTSVDRPRIPKIPDTMSFDSSTPSSMQQVT